MNSLVLSSYFALGVILLTLWAVAMANRAQPAASLTPSGSARLSIDAFAKVCKKKLQRGAS